MIESSSEIGLSNSIKLSLRLYNIASFFDKKENVTASYKPLFTKAELINLFLYSS